MFDGSFEIKISLSNLILPEDGFNKPEIALAKTVWPFPEIPAIPKISCFFTIRLTFEILSLFEEPEIVKLSNSKTASPDFIFLREEISVSSPTINRAIFLSFASLLDISPTFRP